MSNPVQSTTGTVSAGNSCAATLTGTTSGNLIVCLLSWLGVLDTGAHTPLTPAGFSVATAPDSATPSGGSVGAAIYYLISGGGSVTCTFNGFTGQTTNGLYAKMTLLEWGSMTGSPFDVAATPVTNNSAASTTGATVGPSASLAQTNEVVVAVFGTAASTGLANAGISDPPSGYATLQVDQDTSTSVGASHVWKEANSTSGQSCTWAWTSDSTMLSYQMVLATFQELPPGPTITAKPANQKVYEGQTATFTITATGTGTLHYQWKDDGGNVGTDSDTYAVTATLAMDGSIITCDVTDDNGTTTSDNAYLNVMGSASLAWKNKA